MSSENSMVRFISLAVLLVASALGEYVFHWAPAIVFFVGVVAILPLAQLIHSATEALSRHFSGAVSGLLNVTFGNTAELVIALFVLHAGNQVVVKAQITGSIIGNSLLGLGLSVLLGCVGRNKLSFNKEHAGLLSSLMLISVVALLLPAIFDYTERSVFHSGAAAQLDEHLSIAVSIVLIVLYIGNLIYTLVTHHDCLGFSGEDDEEIAGEHGWGLGRAVTVLGLATIATAFEAELISGSLEAASYALHVTPFFLGLTILAVIGNAGEYYTAMQFARKGNVGMTFSVALGSTIQMAMLIAPLLVLVSMLFAAPMSLVFTDPLELAAITSATFIVNSISRDGEVTWFEGALLLGVYLLYGFAFFFATPG